MAKSWELTPEEKQKAQKGAKEAAERWLKQQASKKGTSSSEAESKGQRERELGKGQERER